MKLRRVCILFPCMALGLFAAQAQNDARLDLGARAGAKRQWVSFLGADNRALSAYKSETVTLHFAVAEGLHINSHWPTGESLIATELTLDDAPGAAFGKAVYPAGSEYHFSFDPNTRLDVYSDEFAITEQVTASRGEHRLHGTLRYQACDHASCYPPRTLPVEFTLTAQ